MIDDRAKQFLASEKPGEPEIIVKPGMTSEKAESTLAQYQMKEYLERAGTLAEALIAFFVQQRKKYDYTDDECAGAVALMAINLRYSYGEPQNEQEQETWSDAKREERLAEFDGICEAMQTYADEHL